MLSVAHFLAIGGGLRSVSFAFHGRCFVPLRILPTLRFQPRPGVRIPVAPSRDVLHEMLPFPDVCCCATRRNHNTRLGARARQAHLAEVRLSRVRDQAGQWFVSTHNMALSCWSSSMKNSIKIQKRRASCHTVAPPCCLAAALLWRASLPVAHFHFAMTGRVQLVRVNLTSNASLRALQLDRWYTANTMRFLLMKYMLSHGEHRMRRGTGHVQSLHISWYRQPLHDS